MEKIVKLELNDGSTREWHAGKVNALHAVQECISFTVRYDEFEPSLKIRTARCQTETVTVYAERLNDSEWEFTISVDTGILTMKCFF